MNKIFLFFVCAGLVLTACNIEKDKNIKLTYKNELTYRLNDVYNGTDTSFLLSQGKLIKKWEQYDSIFQLINTETKESFTYCMNWFDYKNYMYQSLDASHYEIDYTNEEKDIFAYKCKKAIITSSTDTLEVYYTKDLGRNYSPKGFIDGFVLEYTQRNKYIVRHNTVISIQDDSPEQINIRTDYIETTKQDYYKIQGQFNSEDNRLPFVKEGQTAPTFKTRDINNDLLDIEQKRGKVLVFNFWFIGCGGCVYEIPDLNKMVEHFKDNKNVEFYAFTGDFKSQVKKFQNRKQFDFTIVPKAEVVNHLYGVNAFPTTLIIDAEGKIAKTYHCTIIEQVGVDNVILEIEKVLGEDIRRSNTCSDSLTTRSLNLTHRSLSLTPYSEYLSNSS